MSRVPFRADDGWMRVSYAVPTTFLGNLKFDEKSKNFPLAHAAVKQIQNGRWAIVWPPTLRTARLLAPGGTKK